LLLCSNKKKLKKVTMEHYVDRIFLIVKLKIDGEDQLRVLRSTNNISEGGIVLDDWEAF
jgi:hypothetical protein